MAIYKEIGSAVEQLEWAKIGPSGSFYMISSYNDVMIKQLKSLIDLHNMEVETKRINGEVKQIIRFDGGWPAVVEAGFEKAEITFHKFSNPKNGYIGYLDVKTETSNQSKERANSYHADF